MWKTEEWISGKAAVLTTLGIMSKLHRWRVIPCPGLGVPLPGVKGQSAPSQRDQHLQTGEFVSMPAVQ